MRIIGGTAAGRILKAPPGLSVRPTPDLVRQAIFNSLGGRVVEATVLELFGGTGALSLESLSRGAKSAICVELSSRHARMIKKNSTVCGFSPSVFSIRVQDVFVAVQQLIATGVQFDLILADPPYGEKNQNKRSVSLAQKSLDNEALPSLLAPGGLFVLGHSKRDTLSFEGVWKERKLLKHGDSLIEMLELE
jgi:16S rRNA (guanine966-N2)-methyltransferase